MLQDNQILTNKFLSTQAKTALFYAIEEAKKHKSDLVTTKFLFYGLIKANPSILNKLLISLNRRNGKFSEDNKVLLDRCIISLMKNKNNSNLNSFSSQIGFSKSVRNLFYSLLRDIKPIQNKSYSKNNFSVITTFSIFKFLVKNESFKNWLKDEIFFIKSK